MATQCYCSYNKDYDAVNTPILKQDRCITRDFNDSQHCILQFPICHGWLSGYERSHCLWEHITVCGQFTFLWINKMLLGNYTGCYLADTWAALYQDYSLQAVLTHTHSCVHAYIHTHADTHLSVSSLLHTLVHMHTHRGNSDSNWNSSK